MKGPFGAAEVPALDFGKSTQSRTGVARLRHDAREPVRARQEGCFLPQT
jgi:hypothetical protein